ncbi:MAG: hypothetical protein DRJ18_02885 [Candidatus Methanomethylicota archaeon]|nr:MAG: hypothetical protein DRJ18_02885 [Candidatus Verstraetearchaeota archaeon]
MKAVFPVETKYDYVVDIEVEDDHVFAVGHLLLHNTDSIFVRLNANGLDEAIDTGVYLENRINAFLRQRFQTDVMTCKFEKIYRRVFFKRGERGVGVKKRYAGWLVWKEGAYVDVVDIKGFEPKRSDTADYTREVMKRFFDILLRKGRDDALRFYRQCIEEFPKQPLWRIAIPKGVKFYSKQYKVENPWLRGSRWAMQHLGWRFREDQKPLLLYVRSTGGLPRTDVVCLPNPDYVLPDEVKVDMQKQLEKAFLQKFRDIIHSLQPTLDAWLR